MEPFYFQPTTATKRIADMQGRIRAVAGGTSASKTISIIFWLIDYCGSDMGRAKLATVVSESYPHLEKGAMLDFENIMKDRGYWKDDRWNKSKHQYTFETGNILEFFSVDTYGKAHGPRRDVLFLNECNNLHYNIVDQLITRTRETVWLDWNPTNEFWFYTEMLGKRNDVDFLTVTYKDNEALDQITIDEIESHRHNKNWWRVYGEGQLGDVEGRVFTGWAFIDEIPHEARLVRRGLDFGYSNDPTAIVDIYYYNGGYILNERLYRKGMHNKPIADFINNMEQPETLVIADSAEPKSIDEIRSYGVNILPVSKKQINGKNYLNASIDYVQDQQISVTKRSLNIRHEYMNYMWKTDKDGNIINDPMDEFNHTLDAVRYGLDGYMHETASQVGIVTSKPYKEENKSFVVNEDGEAEGFHINLEDVAKRAMDDERYRQ